jgi:plastocyanin
MISRAALASAALLLLSTASVSAGVPPVVEMKNNFYDPTLQKIVVGDSVTWHNGSGQTHTTTADLFGTPFWDRTVLNGDSTDVGFQHAGTWNYHCEIHSGMQGKVKVKPTASPSSGTTATVFTIRVAWVVAPSGFIQDIQRRKHGKTWKPWTSTAGQTVQWTPGSTGTWEFRARYRNTSNGTATGWSQRLTVNVS